jgi:hypothetical protein
LKAANLSDKNSFNDSTDNFDPSLRQIELHRISPNLSSGMPKTLASSTSGCS